MGSYKKGHRQVKLAADIVEMCIFTYLFKTYKAVFRSKSLCRGITGKRKGYLIMP